LYVAKVWAENFAVPVFLTFLNTRIWWRGIQSCILSGHHYTYSHSWNDSNWSGRIVQWSLQNFTKSVWNPWDFYR